VGFPASYSSDFPNPRHPSPAFLSACPHSIRACLNPLPFCTIRFLFLFFWCGRDGYQRRLVQSSSEGSFGTIRGTQAGLVSRSEASSTGTRYSSVAHFPKSRILHASLQNGRNLFPSQVLGCLQAGQGTVFFIGHLLNIGRRQNASKGNTLHRRSQSRYYTRR
jgi:hypothetical protein